MTYNVTKVQRQKNSTTFNNLIKNANSYLGLRKVFLKSQTKNKIPGPKKSPKMLRIKFRRYKILNSDVLPSTYFSIFLIPFLVSLVLAFLSFLPSLLSPPYTDMYISLPKICKIDSSRTFLQHVLNGLWQKVRDGSINQYGDTYEYN